jgi:hypothetical protein
MAILFLFSNSQAQPIEKVINQVSFEKAVDDVCNYNKNYCFILKDKNINSYLRKYYKTGLYTIAYIESKFKYKQGFYNKNDISIFQINTYYWNREQLNKLNVKYSYNQIKHNNYAAAYTALRIWLVNISRYIYVYRKYPKSLAEYIALYHRVENIDRHYTRKARKVVYKFLNLAQGEK